MTVIDIELNHFNVERNNYEARKRSRKVKWQKGKVANINTTIAYTQLIFISTQANNQTVCVSKLWFLM